MKLAHNIKALGTLAWVLFIVSLVSVCGTVVVVVWFSLQPNGRATCASFGPYDTIAQARVAYDKAHQAYNAGDIGLDRNGDGIPCELIYKAAHLPAYGE